MATAMAALEARLAVEEEGRRDAHISVLRLEAQVSSRSMVICVSDQEFSQLNERRSQNVDTDGA